MTADRKPALRVKASATARSAMLAALVLGASTALLTSGCSSDDGAQHQAQLSSVQAAQSAADARVASARQYAQDLGPIYAAPPGAERTKWFDKAMGMSCPGSPAAKEYQKSKDAGWLERVQYVPGSRTEVVGAFQDKAPADVIIVAKTIMGNQSVSGTQQQAKVYSTVSRVTIGENAGKACVSKVEYL
ncbi:hypothetical protein GOARA_012_00870 [Gordonia araii NBRC 100433]|uniref:Lipoprotein n=1 Tax=Gordonia araii NBRC 100433 TaxID=1073574 RepID=G7GY62_9ACTN|nr:hypothetical protein [Gordonia araii]NNG98145.1 hypothetical protein [Gordonia araii NBRC 100433]GAB08537.1 hypothetical protein GOARA_012_00870 [Gordonia araii NBRC 100433]